MAELTIRPDEIRDALNSFVENYRPTQTAREEIGTVITSGDGIAGRAYPRPWPANCCASRTRRWASR